MCYQRTEAGLKRVYARSKSLSGSWGSEVLVYTQGAGATHNLFPCLIPLADGSVLLAHWVEDSDSAEAQVRVHRSGLR
jgi:hypothetical protein